MIDVDKLKQRISDDDIIILLSELGADFTQEDRKQIIFYSICHHPTDPMEHKPKLYWYKESRSFYCFACGWRGDIIALVQLVRKCSFIDAMSWVMAELHLEEGIVKQSTDRDYWEKDLKKFIIGYESYEELPIYDKSILKLFKPYYHESWLKDGITKEAMDKFGISWYDRNAQVVIPVYDANGNLVGMHGRNTKQVLVDRGLKYQPIKTLNDDFRFPTGSVLYGLYQNKDNIVNKKSAILVEAPKSVLMGEYILDCNTTVALMGWNCNAIKRDMLLKLGVNEITIALDKQYMTPKGDEFQIYVNQVKKIINLFKPFCTIYVIWDSDNDLKYKDSPFDRGAKIFQKLYKKRLKIS